MKTPSVTSVISPWVDWSQVPPHLLQAAADRGILVHDICLGKICHGIFPVGIPGELRSYVDSFCRWFDLMVDRVIFTERRLYDSRLGYNGQPDLLVESTRAGGIIHVDLKTPVTTLKAWRLQIAAYDHLIGVAEIGGPDKSGTLQLDPAGGVAKMTYYEGSQNQDLSVFLSALNVYRFFNP